MSLMHVQTYLESDDIEPLFLQNALRVLLCSCPDDASDCCLASPPTGRNVTTTRAASAALTKRGVMAYTVGNVKGVQTMAKVTAPKLNPFFVDKKAIQKIVAEQNERMGFVKDPTATPEKAQEMMLALGIRPEDNIFSCGIIAARDEE
jgi:hypothetical protein